MNKLNRWLLDNHIGSFSPQLSANMLNRAEEMEKALKRSNELGTLRSDAETKNLIQEYIAALRKVAVFNGEHCGAVIEELNALVR